VEAAYIQKSLVASYFSGKNGKEQGKNMSAVNWDFPQDRMLQVCEL